MSGRIPDNHREHNTQAVTSSRQPSKKTFANQDLLPRLPVPDLHETCNRFLAWVQPLLSVEDFRRTREIVAQFRCPGGDGERLQRELIEWSRRNDLPNWLEPLWDEMYLKSRLPVAIHKNFSIVCEEGYRRLDQIERSVALIHSALRFKSLIDQEELEAEALKGQPLCMMQYKRLFASTRVPRREMDELRSPCSQENPTSNSAKHIAVFYGGQMFAMDVLSDAGEPRSSEELARDLNAIRCMGREADGKEQDVGILTTMNRDEWADARDILCRTHPQNEASLGVIETSLFALCLEDAAPGTPDELFRVMLHGDGRNRWFDKSFQIIVCQNGRFGVNSEHSGLDGYPIHGLIRFIHADGEKAKTYARGAASQAPRRLEFRITDETRGTIEKAAREFGSHIDDTKIRILRFEEFGKDLVKSAAVSPDAFVQMALQLAQYRLFGKCHSTYESASTRRFLHGRTEALRSVSLESLRFARDMSSARRDPGTLRRRLREAADKHAARMRDCMAGRGVERHLFGLYHIYRRFGKRLGIQSLPEIYQDAGWRKLRHDRLSTTRMPDPHGVLLSGFGPAVEDGFGIVYKIEDDSILFTLTSRATMENALEELAGYLSEALMEMGALIVQERAG